MPEVGASSSNHWRRFVIASVTSCILSGACGAGRTRRHTQHGLAIIHYIYIYMYVCIYIYIYIYICAYVRVYMSTHVIYTCPVIQLSDGHSCPF